jgi:hypothetical protein
VIGFAAELPDFLRALPAIPSKKARKDTRYFRKSHKIKEIRPLRRIIVVRGK